MRTFLPLALLLAACGSTPERPSGRGDAAAPARTAPEKAPEGKVHYSDERPVPKPTAQEMEDFNRVWELFRRQDPSWPLERDRFKRRSDAAAYMLAGHLLQYYMLVNAQRDRAPRDLLRAKNEIVAVGEPCAPALVDLIVLPQIPLPDGRHFIVDDITRMDCVDMLERMGGQAVPELLAVFKRADVNEKGRRLTALALGGTRDPRAYDVLVELLAKDPSWQVRADAATALAKLGDRRAVRPLAEAMKDPDPAVAKRAEKARRELLQGTP